MKAYILNGGHNADELESYQKEIEAVLKGKGCEAESVLLRDLDIGNCMGCFGCWVRTPGECVIDDANREFTRKFINADLVVFLTPITFGGYSSHIKKSLDRFIPAISPFFISIDGETHHRKRYENYPDIFALGITDGKSPDEERVFTELVERNTINMHTRRCSTVVIRQGDPQFDKKIHKGLLEVGR